MPPSLSEKATGVSLVVQWLRLHLPMQGTRVLALVGELRFHMPRGNTCSGEPKPILGNY